MPNLFGLKLVYFLGLLGSVVMGGAMPVYAILFGEVLGVLKLSADEARTESVYYCSLFVAAGVTVGVAVFMQVRIKLYDIF